VGKPEGKRPLGRWRNRQVNNIKVNLGLISWCGTGGLDWICLTQNKGRWRAVVKMWEVPEWLYN
jgi:hypothetical protein